MSDRDLRTTPQQVRSAETIKTILDAAEEVFARRGVDNATTSDIAKAAQISVGRVYYWFKSKEAIVDALGQRATEVIGDLYAAIIATREDYPRYSSNERVLRGVVQLARDNPSLALVLTGESRAMSANLDQLRERIVETSSKIYIAQFPGTSEAEARLVATTNFAMTNGVIGMLIAEEGDDLLREIVYATSAYFACRFPTDDWSISDVVAPARSANERAGPPDEPIRPVTYPEGGPAT